MENGVPEGIGLKKSLSDEIYEGFFRYG